MTLSCNSDSSKVSSSTKFSFIKAKINGSEWTTIQSNGTSFAGASHGALGNPSSIGISGYSASDGQMVHIVLIGNITVGTYQLNYHETILEGSSITFPDSGSSIDCVDSYGMITVTFLDSTKIEGTFSFNNNCGKNSLDVTEGEFKCFFDEDDNSYATVAIGNQIWMQKNLNVSKYSNGDDIPEVTDAAEWSNLTTGAWCYYENNTANGTIYGKLYNWYALNDPRGLAPDGFHIPSDAEWTNLITFLGGEDVAGGKMKATTGWTLPNFGATNSSGFTALPGGCRLDNGTFQSIDTSGFWWSSSIVETDVTSAYNRYLNYGTTLISGIPNNKKNGFSVRCIKD